MELPVTVGVILALVLLVGISEWFFGVATGLSELVLDDRFFSYRIVGASVVSIFLMVGMFVVIATVNECPNEEREGIFAGISCDKYLEFKASTERLFQPNDKTINETFQ